MYVNGAALSPLSTLSPTLYLATLLVICTLSLVYCISEFFTKEDGSQKTVCDIEIRHMIYYFLMAGYTIGVLGIVVFPGTERALNWGTAKVHYSTLTHFLPRRSSHQTTHGAQV